MQAHKEKLPSSSAAAKAAAVLRAQIKFELQNKKQCAYHSYECTQLTIDGYQYCKRHILNDKNAPFRQCSYVYNSNGKRCFLPAPKAEKKDAAGYCNEHSFKANINRAKQGSKPQAPRTAEVLLNSLSHYVKRPRTRTASSSTQYSDDGGRTTPDEGESKVTKSLNPFVDIDATQVNASRSDILDMCSDSESDVEAATYSSVWQDAQADSSENESIDSDHEDVLKHANVYSAEEITLITRDKLVKLKALYTDQYRHLQNMLKERRRKYLHNLKREKETCCSISSQARDNIKEQRMYKKLRAYNLYHRRIGPEAILRKRLNEMRLQVTEGCQQHKQPSYQAKCAFTEGGVKCSERALPVTRHCRKHILEDSNQVLFRACGKKRADIECPTPVETIFDDQTCALHRDIPVIRSYAQFRKDSESDYDESGDLHANNPNVKTELMEYNPMASLFNEFVENQSLDGELDMLNDIDNTEQMDQLSKIIETDNQLQSQQGELDLTGDPNNSVFNESTDSCTTLSQE